jgi:hypothetical protein
VSENAKRGLAYHKEGRSGSGLKPQTVREARDMVEGAISPDKVRRMGAWLRRHKSDLKAPKNSDPDAPGYPGPGLVAWLLWGGDANGSMRAAEWAERKAAELEETSARLTPTGLKMEQVEITIEARALAAEAKVAELTAAAESAASLLTEAKSEVEAAFKARDEAKAAAVEIEARLMQAEARVAELEKATAPAAAQAAAIVAACSAEPANVTPAVVNEAPARELSAFEKWQTLSGAERTAYFEKNKPAIQREFNAKR